MKILVAGSQAAFNQIRPEYETFVGLANMGHQVTAAVHDDCPYIPRLQEAGIKLIHAFPRKKICRDTIRTLRRELQSAPYDIVYATTSKTIPNAAFSAFGMPLKFVAYRGTTGGLYRHDPTAYLTILHPRVDGVICVSNAVRDDVLQRVWKNKDQVVTIYKGHELSWYASEPGDLGEFNIAPGSFVIICAVNVRPSKGIDIMLEAANDLADIDNLHLLMIGEGMDQEPYSSLIANNRMRERIHVCGFRYDAPELIAASDVLVQPSRSGEGLPRSVMESIGYGTPVIITDTGGGKEVVEDGKSGFVIPTEDPGAIVDRVRRVYADPDLLQQFASNARQRVQENFSSAQTVAQYDAYFRKLIAAA